MATASRLALTDAISQRGRAGSRMLLCHGPQNTGAAPPAAEAAAAPSLPRRCPTARGRTAGSRYGRAPNRRHPSRVLLGAFAQQRAPVSLTQRQGNLGTMCRALGPYDKGSPALAQAAARLCQGRRSLRRQQTLHFTASTDRLSTFYLTTTWSHTHNGICLWLSNESRCLLVPTRRAATSLKAPGSTSPWARPTQPRQAGLSAPRGGCGPRHVSRLTSHALLPTAGVLQVLPSQLTVGR